MSDEERGGFRDYLGVPRVPVWVVEILAARSGPKWVTSAMITRTIDACLAELSARGADAAVFERLRQRVPPSEGSDVFSEGVGELLERIEAAEAENESLRGDLEIEVAGMEEVLSDTRNDLLESEFKVGELEDEIEDLKATRVELDRNDAVDLAEWVLERSGGRDLGSRLARDAAERLLGAGRKIES